MTEHLLRLLVISFDYEFGLPETAYEATRDLIEAYLGEESAKVFAVGIDATDGGFYTESDEGESLWQAVLAARTK